MKERERTPAITDDVNDPQGENQMVREREIAKEADSERDRAIVRAKGNNLLNITGDRVFGPPSISFSRFNLISLAELL